MHTHFADWYRQASFKPEDSWLKLRWQAVEAAASETSASKICELARLYHRKPLKAPEFEDQFRLKFHEADNAFQMSGNDFEISLLAWATRLHMTETCEQNIAIAAAFAVTCPTLQGKCSKGIVTEIVDRARAYLQETRRELRREPVPPDAVNPICFDEEALKPLVDAWTTNQFPEAGKHLSKLLERLGRQLEHVATAERCIERYQSLYREESDILWWLTGKCSRDLEIPFHNIEQQAACTVAGKELADLVRVLPGPLGAPAILDTVISTESPASTEVSLSEAINKTDRDWREQWVTTLNTTECLDLSPILFAVNESIRVNGANAWHSVFKTQIGISPTTKLPARELAEQVYEECLSVRTIYEIGE